MAPMFRLLVPRDRPGEQALVAIRLLRQALDAVWHVHSEEMAVARPGHPVEVWEDSFSLHIDVVEDDDIPF